MPIIFYHYLLISFYPDLYFAEVRSPINLILVGGHYEETKEIIPLVNYRYTSIYVDNRYDTKFAESEQDFNNL